MDVPVKRGTTEAAEVERAPERPYFIPDVDIYETDDGWTLLADMPGVDPDQVSIGVEEGNLALSGPVRLDLPEDAGVRYCEGDVCDYHRVFRLGQQIDADKVEAGFENGVLRVRLPKWEWGKTKKIEVK